jgi:ribosomal protein S12 methylthiotransferase accessory factor
MDMIIDFPGGSRVDAHYGNHVIKTDQPIQGGGEDSAPTPFAVFLASIGTCAGIYVLGFCRSRNLPTEGIRIVEKINYAMNGLPQDIDLEIQVPPEFPEKYYDALVRVADQCKVKQTIANPPQFNVYTKVAE